MLRATILMAVWAGQQVWGGEEPAGLLDRFTERIQGDLERLPDYVCTESVERFGRSSAESPWEKIDMLRLEVAFVAGRELYGFPGEHRFQDRPLAELAGRGTIGTGPFALLAQHLFVVSRAQFTYRGENSDEKGTRYEYGFDVPPTSSSYKLRAGAVEATVGFQGTFWIDAESLDLIQLDVQAYDIDEKLGLSQADTTVHYARANIEGKLILLPTDASLAVVAVDGVENLNRTRLGACRQYSAESTIRFEPANIVAATKDRTANRSATGADPRIPGGTLIELTLDSEMNLAAMSIGDKVSAHVTQAIRDGDRVLIASGAMARGHLVRLEKHTIPFPSYEIGLEFETLENGGRTMPFAATMVDAGPSSGLIKQAKSLDPKFTRRGPSRMDILVKEFQRGQGILNWDARRGVILRGLRMKWKVESTTDQ